MELCRVQLVSCPHAADDRNLAADGSHDDLKLCCHGVHSIHHIGILREIKFVGVFRKVKALSDLHLSVRVDFQDPVTHDLRLVLSDGLSRRDDLAVDVREADLIVIHQHKRADSAPRQRFSHISADSADTKDRHLCLRETVHIFRS